MWLVVVPGEVFFVFYSLLLLTLPGGQRLLYVHRTFEKVALRGSERTISR